MKNKKIFFLLWLLMVGNIHATVDKNISNTTVDVAAQEPDDLILFDEIKVIVFGGETPEIITKSDLSRKGLDGSQPKLSDLVLESLMVQDAQKYKSVGIMPDDEAVDKHLASVMRENNLSRDEMNEIFKASGYATYEEGREKFKRMTTVNAIGSFKIQSRLIVPERDIIAYCDAHPETEEASYFIQRGVVPGDAYADTQAFTKALKASQKSGKELSTIEWSEPFWLKRSEIAEDKAFLFALKEGEISAPAVNEDGWFEVYRMKEVKPEHVKTPQERYREVADILRKPRYDQLFKEYKQGLFDNASIVYL